MTSTRAALAALMLLIAPPPPGLAQQFKSVRQPTQAFAEPVDSGPADADVIESSGDARLTLPIPVPVGTGGFAPSLTLVYSSSDGDGPFGVGWSLPLGEIRRTARFGIPTGSDSVDKFEFDDELLVRGATTSSGVEYRTATESFRRFTLSSSSGGWVVNYPDGKVARFGETEQTRVRRNGPGTPIIRWLLEVLEDVNGNSIAFTYNSERLPSAITYGAGGTTTERSIRFAYETRPDPINRFSAGARQDITQRVTDISSSVGSQPFQRLVLRYASDSSYSTKRSRLASAQLFGTDCPYPNNANTCASNGKGRPAQQFIYSDPVDTLGTESSQWENKTSGGPQVLPVPLVNGNGNTTWADWGVRFADVNGDGLNDLVQAHRNDLAVEFHQVRLNLGGRWGTGSLSAVDAQWTEALKMQLAPTIPTFVWQRHPIAEPTSPFALVTGRTSQTDVPSRVFFEYHNWPAADVVPTTPIRARLVDINNDGFSDIVLSYNTGRFAGSPEVQRRYVWLNKGLRENLPGASSPFDAGHVGWFLSTLYSANLPALDDSLIVNETGTLQSPPGAANDAPYACGPDRMLGWRVDSGGPPEGPGTNSTSVWHQVDRGVRFVELNGDGFPDIVGSRTGIHGTAASSFAYLNDPATGTWVSAPQFAPPVNVRETFNYLGALPNNPHPGPHPKYVVDADNAVRFVDLNGDGLDDIIKTALAPATGLPDNFYLDASHGPLPASLTQANVWINTGQGWCGIDSGCGFAAKYLPPAGLSFTRISIEHNRCLAEVYSEIGWPTVTDNDVNFQDLNGDGLVDMLRTDDVRNISNQPISGGEAWLQSPGEAGGTVWKRDARFDVAVNQTRTSLYTPVGSFGSMTVDNGTRVFDADGDGISDFIHHDGVYNVAGGYVMGARSRYADRMRLYENGEGGTIAFEYASPIQQRKAALESDAATDELDTLDIPSNSGLQIRWTSRPVVSKLTVSGLDIQPSAPFETVFTYARPRWCPARRSGLGFRLVEAKRPDGSFLKSFFWQAHGRAGQSSRADTEIAVAGPGGVPQRHLRNRATADWQVVSGSGVAGSIGGVDVGRVTGTSQANYYAGGATGAVQSQTFSYADATWGFNFPTVTETTRPTGYVRVERAMVPLDSAEWIALLPDWEKTYSGPVSLSNLVADRDFTHDSRGNVLLLRDMRRERGTTAGNEYLNTTFSYDAYGNITSQTDAEGRTTKFCYDGDTSFVGGGSCPATGMTSATHSVVTGIKEMPAIAGITAIDSDLGTGQATHVVSYNGDISSITLDPFGRPKFLYHQPYGDSTPTLLSTRNYFDIPDATVGRRYWERFDEIGDGFRIRSAVYFDGFRRIAREVSEAKQNSSGTASYFGTATLYDFAGRPTLKTLPSPCASGNVHCTHLDNLNPAVLVPADHRVAKSFYDELGRVIRVEDPSGITTASYLAAARAQMGSPTANPFDLVIEKNVLGSVTQRYVDGDRTVFTDECRSAQSAGASAPTPCSSNFDSTYTRFEATGEVGDIFNARAANLNDPFNRLRYVYDTTGNVIRIEDPDAGTTSVVYDFVGNPLTITNPRQQNTTFLYDDLARMWRKTHVDAAGNSVTTTITFDDGLGGTRKPKTVTSAQYSLDLQYEKFGRLKQRKLTTTGRTLIGNWTYDLLGRPLTYLLPITPNEKVHYRYAGNYLDSICFERDGQSCASGTGETIVSSISYDNIGRETGMTLTTGSTLVGNYTREFELLTDRLQRQKFVSAGGSALFELEYAYQQGSYLHGITDRHAGAASDGFDATAIFSYDPRSRLLSRTLAADASGTARFFGYDELGNLILRDGATAGANANQLYSGPRPHQLTQSTLLNKTYAYDASGNVTRRGSQYYAYDSENRLGCVGTSSSPCSSVVNSFAYDLDGNRIWEARSLTDVSIFFGSDFEYIPASPGKSRFHVIANGRVIATRNIDSTALRTELGGWLPFVDWSARELSPAVIALALSSLLLAALAAGRRQPWAEHPIRTAAAYGVLLSLVVPPVAVRAGGAPPAISNRFTFSDHLGSPMLSINTAGSVVFRRVLEPFGRVIVETNPGETDPDLYTGKRRERISGLVDFGARWYDPEVGRFTALDPIAGILEDPQTHNGYSYVNNNPSNNIDPDGRCAWWGCLDLILYAAIAAAGSYAAATSGNSGSSGQGQAGATFSFGGSSQSRGAGHEKRNTASSTRPSPTESGTRSLNFAGDESSQSVDVYLRTFAPFESFGGGFAGDNRGFSTDLNATSRISGRVSIDPATGQVLGATAQSSPTSCAGAPCSLVFGDTSRTGTPTISARNVNGAIVVTMAGANPLVPGAPDIDLSLTLRVGASGLSGSLVGDAFPNAEVFVVGPGGATMLHTFTTPGGPTTGPFLYLPGANTRPMGGF